MKRIKVGVGLLALLFAASLTFVACDTGSSPSRPIPPGVFEVDYDIIVVGSGITGSMAALAARDAGPYLNILLIEEQGLFGGHSAAMAGQWSQIRTGWGLNNDFTTYLDWPALPNGDPDLTDPLWIEWDASWTAAAHADGSPFPNMEKARGVVQEITRAVDYIRQLGLGFIEFRDAGLPRLWHVTSYGGFGGGPILMTTLRNAMTSRGIAIALNAKATDITTDEYGVINGVVVNDNIEVRGRRVILATGGFSGDTGPNGRVTLWSGNHPGVADAIPRAQNFTTGQGIELAVAAGGSVFRADGSRTNNFLEMDGTLYLGSPNVHPSVSFTGTGITNINIQDRAQLINQVVVNRRGQRFIDENVRLDGWGLWTDPPAPPDRRPAASTARGDLARAMFVDGPAPYWIIYDSRPLVVGGNNIPAGLALLVDVGQNNDIPTNTAWPRGTHRLVATSLGTADNGVEAHLRALAAQMELDATDTDAFVAMMLEYNDLDITTLDPVRTGTRVPLITPPFFAIQLRSQGSTGTIGGVATSRDGEVLNVAGNVVPNLFAVGEMANRELFGNAQVGGASVTMYAVMGKRAGTLAATQVLAE